MVKVPFDFPAIYQLPIPASYCKYASFLRMLYDEKLRLAYPELRLRALVKNFDSIAILEAEILQAVQRYQSVYNKLPHPPLLKKCEANVSSIRRLLSDNAALAQYLLRNELVRVVQPREAVEYRNRQFLVYLYQTWSEPLVRAGYRLPDIINAQKSNAQVLQAHLVTLAAYYQQQWNASLVAPKFYIDPEASDEELRFWNEHFIAYIRRPAVTLSPTLSLSCRTAGGVLSLPFAVLYDEIRDIRKTNSP